MKKLGSVVLVLVPVCVLILLVSCGYSGDQDNEAGAKYQEQEVLVSSLPQVCGDGLDNDGDTFTDFPNDAGCLSLLDNNEITDCQDGVDNDGDTTIDLSDPGCIDANDLSELGGECDDWLDNDGDGRYDMADPGCSDLSDTNEQDAAVECDDGADNDGDTLTDLIDPGCRNSADTSEYLGTVCDNGLDDDGDTFLDYPADAGCLSLFDNREITDCQDGVDNDGDTNIDFPADTGCSGPNDTMELSVVYECWDGIDNDGDTLRDYPSDPDCVSETDNMEAPPECSDGIDNDGDTFSDIGDPGCFGNPLNLTEIGQCQDTIDNDGDTFTDFPDDPECASLPDSFEGLDIYVWVDSPSSIENGTIANPFKSIQAGINVAGIGQDVLVAEGIYNENITLGEDVDLFGGFNTSFISRNPDLNRTVINAPVSTLDAVYGNSLTDNVSVDGFEIIGGRHGIYFVRASAPTISNNYIHGSTKNGIHLITTYFPYLADNTISDITAPWWGIYVATRKLVGPITSSYPSIKYNTIDVASSGGSGINITSCDFPYIEEAKVNFATISNTFISGMAGINVNLKHTNYYSYGYAGLKYLKNSIIRDSDIAIKISVDYYWFRPTVYANIESSTIAYNNYGLDAYIKYFDPDTTVFYSVRNSILSNNTNWHIQPSISATLDISYTDFWGPVSCNCTPGPGVQFVDPLFNPDFTLQPASPLIDAGDPNASYDDAIPPGQGTVRNDMGAFGGPGASGIIGTRTPFSP